MTPVPANSAVHLPIRGQPMPQRSRMWRQSLDVFFRAVALGAAVLGIAFLFWILASVVTRGAGVLAPSFFTELPPPPGGSDGGLGNAMLGTLYMTALAMVLGVPVGLVVGVFLNEFGRYSKLGAAVRFSVSMTMGVPSIIMGLFVYTLLVVPMGHFSGLAGAVSLALLMLPIVARTTDEMLSLVPNTLRESALALGAPRWRVMFGVLFPVARAGILTGVLLALARVSGESAPLLFTALNSPYWAEDMLKPVANLTVTIFAFAMSPYAGWQAAAWGASLVITSAVLITTIAARIILRNDKT